MNLKFWKKKTAIEADAAPSAPGLFAKIKAQAATLGSRFKRKPKFQAEVATETPDKVEALPPQQESTDRPALFARVKAVVMNLTYRQVLIAGAVLLILLLLAVGYAAWSIIRSSPDKNVDITELVDTSPTHALPAILPGSAPEAASAVISASAVEAASEVSAASAPEIAHAASAVPDVATHMTLPVSAAAATLPIAAIVAPASHAPQSELEVLRQKNAELQKQVDELKKAQRASSRVKLYPPEKRALPGGHAIVGTSAPKAAAETLKETIEKMNSGAGTYRK